MNATQALQAHIDSDPFKSNGPATFWVAEEALDAQPEDVPLEVLEGYYARIQASTPEVPPRLEKRNARALEGWLRAAARRPDVHWNQVLLQYSQGDPEAARRGFRILRSAWEAPADPEIYPTLQEGATDPQLVQALRDNLQARYVTDFPVGWIAILVRAGHLEASQQVRQSELIAANDLDDLRRLCPDAEMPEVDAAIARRDQATRQADLFAALGMEMPRLFHHSVTLPAKSGHRFCFYADRDWRSTAVWWNVFVGKSQAGFIQNPNGVMTNKLKLEPVELGRLREWLEALAPRLKTRWLGPPEVEPVEWAPAWQRYLSF